MEWAGHGSIPLGRDTNFGRIEGNEVVLADQRVSRRHAVVQGRGGTFHLVDLGSTNGTFVNDIRIHRPTRLNDADVIGIGGQRFVFCQPLAPGDDHGSAMAGTAVFTGKTACWMLLASGSASGNASLAEVQAALIAGSATVKSLPSGSQLAHWRVDLHPPSRVLPVVERVSTLFRPSDAWLALHYGTVRVGGAVNSADESLLGAEVAFLHQLGAKAAELRPGLLVSEAAVASLGAAGKVRSLGKHALAGSVPFHEVFGWARA